ncbi:MAG TPA: hypothetical protein VIB79_10860 [Candidatus Binatia bacterium]
MSLRFGWPLRPSRRRDAYWDFFINTPPADLANSAVEMIRSAPQGNIFPTKADIHTPEVTASHVKDLARYLGADLVGIVRLEPRNSVSKDVEASYPFGVISAVRAAYDPREARGIGGQVPVQNGLFITFVLSAWIRELGFRATVVAVTEREQLAARAGLGTIARDGKLTTREFGRRIYVADVIETDLPVAADG